MGGCCEMILLLNTSNCVALKEIKWEREVSVVERVKEEMTAVPILSSCANY